MPLFSNEIKTTGRWGEEQAARYLRRQGFRILARNVSCRFGEIDIIAADREYILFVEVKTRKSADFAEAREFVNFAKQRRIHRAAMFWLSEHETELQPRFDVIEIYGTTDTPFRKLVIRHIADAFS